MLDAALRLAVESPERWELVTELHKRADEATFQAASALVASPDPVVRGLGVDVLAQAGAYLNVPTEARPFRSETVQLLLDRLQVEGDPDVLESIAVAFGHLRDSRSIPALRDLRQHSDERVRHGVVFGLMGVDEDLAVQTLIELSTDESADVRDWATFGLGVQIKRDDPEVRAALLDRIDDPDDDTREEAIRGLAMRGDRRVIPALLHELSSGGARDDLARLEEALLALASSTSDIRLCKHVYAREAEWQRMAPNEPLPDDLQSAIRACAGPC